MTEKATKRGRPKKTKVGPADHLTEKKLFFVVDAGYEPTNLAELIQDQPAFTTMKAAKAEIFPKAGGSVIPVTITAAVSGPIRTIPPEEPECLV
jgi:hypothetical protein